MTPAEFNGFSRTLAKKRDSEVNLTKASVYWAESLARTKKLPGFDQWMNPPKPARALTGDEAEKRLAEHREDVAMIEGLMAAKAKEEEERHKSDG